MFSFGNKRWLLSLGATLAIAVVGATLSSSCKPKEGVSKAKAQPSGSSSAKPGPELTAPCQAYIDALCDKVGKSSQNCTSMTTAAELLSPAACNAAKRDLKYTLDIIAEKRKACDTLVSRLCGELGKTTETCKMVETHTKNFPPERCKMMLERYADVLKDLKRMEEQNKPLDAEKQKELVAGNPPSFGPATAKVTLVEFSDFQCPYCSKAAKATEELKKKYGDKVHFVFRQFPLGFHKEAGPAAQAALYAHAKGKFWEFHDKLFADQKNVNREGIEKVAKEVGLNVDELKKALDSKSFEAAVNADMELGKKIGVQGTPSLFVNGKKVQNASDSAAIGKMIDEALAGK